MRRNCLWLVWALLAACTPRPEPGSEPVPPADTPATSETSFVTVYFPDTNVDHLEAEAIDLPTAGADLETVARMALEALLAGPTEEGHSRVIPASTRLLGVTIADKLATVDFNRAFADDFQGGSGVAALAVGSVVNTLGELDGIERVLILLDGQPAGDFAGVLSLAEPLEPEPSLIGGRPLGTP